MIRSLTESELIQEGERLGGQLAPHAIVALEGELGTGKTTFATAVARGLGVAEPATSPTYALVHRYVGRRGPVYHVDCYRLRRPEEAEDLDWEALLAEGDALIVEWPERAGTWMPRPTHRLRFYHLAEESRRGVEALP
ncbi:MAG TPA: tRNA (adenosine(37)-N6)-threonylcarbamoyltransferase complex ATPase subunit type 1 TsaE [Gemmatimonadales bacterium]|nr:tRNA (adenosine(37)-N6)-threonylcarbamoyltransferase complex ATPase subunit type 1 TsaE [Gemmatimonadales bacterium]